MRTQKRTISLAFSLLAFFSLATASRGALLTMEREELPGGGILIVKNSPQLPIVTIRVSVRAGSRHETPQLAGLASMTAASLARGTAGRSASDIEKLNDRLGGGVEAGAGRDFAGASLRVLVRDLEQGMDLLADILRRPVFPQKEFTKTQRRILGGLIRRMERPGSLADEKMRGRLFGEHPYGRLTSGTPETVKAIRHQDLTVFHRKWYGMKNAIFVFVGDITLARARELVLERFSGWKAEGGQLPPAPLAPAPKGLLFEKVDKPLAQATIILANRSLRRTHPDFYAARIMNYILGGGGFDSRILNNIREEKGLVYAAYSYFDAGLDSGHWRLFLQTRNESAREAITESIAEIKRIKKEGVTDKELAEAKSYITGNFATRLTSSSQISDYILAIERLGFPPDYADKYLASIRAVTKEQVQAAARKYIRLDEAVLAIVGNLEKTGIDDVRLSALSKEE
ncbi:MAG: pitrilysin family protein [bacterium]|nr:pitrilysin family protein [bacterium]